MFSAIVQLINSDCPSLAQFNSSIDPPESVPRLTIALNTRLICSINKSIEIVLERAMNIHDDSAIRDLRLKLFNEVFS